jgi:hypothetical protein
LDVHPVAHFPELAVVEDTIGHGDPALLHYVFGIGFLLLSLCNLPRLFLEMDGVLVDLAVLLVVLLGVLKHELDVLHEVVHRIVLLALQLAL